MMTITITFEEAPDQHGPARRVQVKIKAQGYATQAEHECAERFRPLLEEISGTAAIIGKSAKPS